MLNQELKIIKSKKSTIKQNDDDIERKNFTLDNPGIEPVTNF